MPLVAEVRKESGRAACRRLRRNGTIPAVLYGRGGSVLSLSLDVDEVLAAIRSESQILELQVAGDHENVLIKDVQYDHLGEELLHLDFERVSMDEEITVSVPIETHGRAPGVEQEEGVFQHPLKELEVICLPGDVPGSIVVEIGEMHLEDTVHVRDLVLPEGVRTETDPDQLVIQITPPQEEEEEAAPEEMGAAEPELIRPEGREEEEPEE